MDERTESYTGYGSKVLGKRSIFHIFSNIVLRSSKKKNHKPTVKLENDRNTLKTVRFNLISSNL